MTNNPEVPQWVYRLQLFFGVLLILLAIFLYYAVVPRGLDQKVPFVLLGFGAVNIFFGRTLFSLPQKQKERAAMLKAEKEKELKKQQKTKEKKKK